MPNAIKALTALITAVAGLLTALATAGIFPFDSQAGGGGSGLSGTLSNVLIADSSLSLGDFCDRRSLPCDSVDESERLRPGNVFGYTIETVGYEGQRLPIKWSMYDAATNRRVTEPTLLYQDGWPDGVYTPAAATDRNSGELWVPLPPTSGRFFVRLELFPPDGARLDWEDSPPFDVS
jgi:hypothetical protein